MNQVNSPKLSYRAEIDGLRAIAVVSVILYHAQMVLFGRDWFEGGFIGVDIFFVISGYLITRIILSELELKGSFSFLNFYERRARRILPMLFVVIFVSVPYAWQKLLTSDFVEYAESILASIFFGSNFFFYFSTTEYGADSALLKPFLHTWSLGVEEQFYLVFPILAIVAFRYFRKHFLTILVGLSLLSLQFAELMEVRNSDLNFYLPFSRFWELAVGSMLAFRELYYKSSNENFASKSLSMLGLYLIAYSILFFDGETPHPSFHTLIPIIGVALIIGFASKDELVGKLLGSKPFVWVGLISYSAYLWHFPIFAFSRMGEEPTNYEKFELIGVAFSLSIFSYFFIEKPFRKNTIISQKSFMAISVVAVFITVTLAVLTINKEGFVNRMPPILLSILDKDGSLKKFQTLKKGDKSCFNRRIDKHCVFGKGLKSRVVVVGDSHMGALSSQFFSHLKYKVEYVELTKGGCPFVVDYSFRCGKQEQLKRLEIINERPSTVVLFSRFPQWLNNKSFSIKGDHKDLSLKIPKYKHNRKVLFSNFKATVDLLIENGHNVVLVYPTSEVGLSVPRRILSYFYETNAEEVERYYSVNPLSNSYKSYTQWSSDTFALFDEVKHKNLIKVYPHRLFCDTFVVDRCVSKFGDEIFFSDQTHLSVVGANLVADQIFKSISDADFIQAN